MIRKFPMMKKTLLKVVLSAIFLLPLGYQSAVGQSTTNQELIDKVGTYVASTESKGFSGVILVEHKGRKIWSGGVGYADSEKNIKNTNNTIFDIGSVSKQFTGAAILKLEMQGKLSTDDKMVDYIAGVPENLKHITLHHLLTHSAGMEGAIGHDYEEISENDFIEKALKTVTASRIGKEYEYSNVGYSLLAIIIEKVSGMKYEAYLRKFLFLPAKMEHTGYVLPQWSTENIAVGYKKNKAWGKPIEKKWAEDGPHLHLKGNGGILSTVDDLYKWHLALESGSILSEKALKKYYHPHIKEDPSGRSFYGYGWAIFPTPRKTHLIAHNGGNGIFFADFWRYRSEEITIIVLANTSNRYSEDMASEIAGIMLQKS